MREIPMRRIALVAIVVALLPMAYSTPQCYPTLGSCYEFKSSPGITWHEARLQATYWKHGFVYGHLAVITSQAENDAIAQNMGSINRAWIGASDEAMDGEFALFL